MSILSHSPAPFAIGNDNVSAERENPPTTSANHSSPAPSAACNNNVLAKGKKPLRPFSMSSANHSPATSVVCNSDVSDKGKESAWGSPFNEANEAGPSVIGGSALYPDLSDSIRTSPQGSYSDDIPQRCQILNHNYNGSINGVFQNGKPLLPSANLSSLDLSNGLRPRYNDENGWRNCSRCGNRKQSGYCYRYDQDRCHEVMTNSYQGFRGMAPQMQQPPEQLRPFQAPLTSPPICPLSFNGDHVPSFWSTFQGPIGLSYVPFDVYRYPVHPQAQFFSGPSYVVPRLELEATQPQQSDFSSSLDDLRARLRKQIEYYFSWENLCTDYYLKNLMDGCGWVPITLIMKFRKVVALLKEKEIKMQSASISDVLQVQDRSLSNDQLFVLDSVRPSDALEVQDDRMRKRHEWEKWVLN